MFDPKIRVSRALYERLRGAAERCGYAGVEEMARDILERAAREGETGAEESEAEVRKRLQGLGYLG